MPHPHRRTWTLGELDRAGSYRLWFDAEAFRWEVEPEGSGVGPAEVRAAGDDRACAEDPPNGRAGGNQGSGRVFRWPWSAPA